MGREERARTQRTATRGAVCGLERSRDHYGRPCDCDRQPSGGRGGPLGAEVKIHGHLQLPPHIDKYGRSIHRHPFGKTSSVPQIPPPSKVCIFGLLYKYNRPLMSVPIKLLHRLR